MSTLRLRDVLLLGGLLAALLASGTLAFAARRISAEQAVYRARSAGRCTPTTLNRSAVLSGTRLAVSPLPGSYRRLAIHPDQPARSAARSDQCSARERVTQRLT